MDDTMNQCEQERIQNSEHTAQREPGVEEAIEAQDKGSISQEAEPTVPELVEQLVTARAQAEEYLDNWRRATAELSNARKRMLREQADFRTLAAGRVIEKLLPVVDDMERGLAALPADQGNSDWGNGFRLIQQKLHALLESEGVVPIPAEGEVFDPELHHAVTHEECEGYSEGQIIAEVARGYKLGDKVLRPSLVRVARAAQQPA